MSTEEAFAVLCDINRKGGIVGHDSPHDNDVRPCPACENIRALALTVHIEACHETSGDGYHGSWSYCGGDYQVRRYGQQTPLDTIWYCSVAQQYLSQK